MARLTDRIRQMLVDGAGIDGIQDCSERALVRALNMLTHSEDDLARQMACRELAKIIAGKSPERIKNAVRRLLWRLSPESGDYPVGTPELFGEIGHLASQHMENFIGAFLFYLDDETLRPGLLQAAGRIGQKTPDILLKYIDEIAGYLRDKNPAVAGNAALALCRIDSVRAQQALQAAETDERKIDLLCGGKPLELTISEIASHCRMCGSALCFVARQGMK